MLAATAVALATFALTGGASTSGAVGGSPTDWDPSDWAQLSPADQAVEWTDYDDGTGDPSTKAAWVQAHPETSFDSEAAAAAAADGPGSMATTGVLEARASPFSVDQYIWENQWQNFNADRTILTQVFAGRRASDVSAGVLLINDIPQPSDSGVVIGTVTVIDGRGQGSIRIIGEDGSSLFVSDLAGTGTLYLQPFRSLVWNSGSNCAPPSGPNSGDVCLPGTGG